MGRARLRTCVLAVAAAVASLSPSATAAPVYGETTVVTTVPYPGHPEGILVDGGVFHVTTTVGFTGVPAGDGEPSRLFTFGLADGALRKERVLRGENTRSLHGAAGVVRDSKGRLYVAIGPWADDTGGGSAVIRVDGDRQSLYGSIPNIPPCTPLATAVCSPTLEDRAPLANDVVFDRDGSLYVSDSFQATVWRIPPGGGAAEAWLQDPLLHGYLVGPNGLRVGPDGRHLFLAVMAHEGRRGTIYRVPLRGPKTLDVFHEWTGESPDGITFGRSGKLYVVLGEGVLSVLSADGSVELARITSEHFHNPASLFFDDRRRRLLVTNHAFDDPDPAHATVVAVQVDEAGAPLARPRLP